MCVERVLIRFQNEVPCVYHVCQGKVPGQCNSKHASCCFAPGSASDTASVAVFVWCFKKVAQELKLPAGLDDVSVYIVGTVCNRCGAWFVMPFQFLLSNKIVSQIVRRIFSVLYLKL